MIRATAARLCGLLTFCLLLWAPPLHAQGAAPLRVGIAEESLRAAPGGAPVAVLQAGTELAGGAVRQGWREVTLEGWIAAGAVSRSTRDGFDLVVAAGGAPLYASPGGAALGRGMGGLLLDEVERQGGWVRVRRTGWLPIGALAAAPAVDRKGSGDGAVARVLQTRPGGDTLGTLAAAAPLEVVGREGEWARVRVEGWIRVPPGAELPGPSAAGSVSLAEMRDDPERFRGRAVRWEVSFVSLQRADTLRTDLAPGEMYMLARDPGGEPGFIYVTVPPALLPQVRRLVPLQRVALTGRVRTGRSALMGHPVLELTELRPLPQRTR